jgi:hypothetical protein
MAINVSRTASRSCRISPFQNLTTDHPFVFMKAFRFASWSLFACWLPSTSTTSSASRQAKSAKYGPIGNCRTNLCPARRRARNSLHKAASASFSAFRRLLARAVFLLFAPRICAPFDHTALCKGPSPYPLPASGERGNAWSAARPSPRLRGEGARRADEGQALRSLTTSPPPSAARSPRSPFRAAVPV